MEGRKPPSSPPPAGRAGKAHRARGSAPHSPASSSRHRRAPLDSAGIPARPQNPGCDAARRSGDGGKRCTAARGCGAPQRLSLRSSRCPTSGDGGGGGAGRSQEALSAPRVTCPAGPCEGELPANNRSIEPPPLWKENKHPDHRKLENVSLHFIQTG